MPTRTLISVLAAAALAGISAPSFAQTGPEPTASSQGLQEEPGFIVESIVIPEGFTAENISGYYLEHDLTTDTWTAEFVFESDFTEYGYVDGGTYDGGDGSTGREISGGQTVALEDGVMLGAGKQVATTRTTVTKTTSSSWSVRWAAGFIPIITWKSGTSETTTTETTITIRVGRLTEKGGQGRLPPPHSPTED